MVLDTLQQYLRYAIRPPESLPQMRAQYDAAQKGKGDSQWGESFKLTPNSPERVKALWSDLVKWYRKDYPRVAKNVPSDTDAAPAEGARQGVVGRVLNAIAPSRSTNAAGAAMRDNAIEDGAVYRVLPAAEEAEPMMEKAADNAPAPASAPKMVLKPWTPDTPYIPNLDLYDGDAFHNW